MPTQTGAVPQKVSFDNTAIAFASNSNNDLRRSYFLFNVLSYNRLIPIFSVLAKTALRLHLPVKGLIKATVFRQFCGGESIEECKAAINNLARFNVKAILDYSVEGKEDEEEFDRTLHQILACINTASGNPNIPFSVFKPTGIARLGLLTKVSETIEYQNTSSSQSRSMSSQSPTPSSQSPSSSLPTDANQSLNNTPQSLTPEEESEFLNIRRRVETICATAHQQNVPIFIDAEESWTQPVIDNLAREMMLKYNTTRPLIFNTIQLYRTDRLDFLRAAYAHAVEHNYFLGLKLVRGAYMEKERERAVEMDYPSPILPDKAATDKSYNDALKFCVEHIDRIATCAGAHNEKSAYLLMQWMGEKNLPNDHPHIWFSQLLGMSDHISFNLAQAGYNVCKYVPYGPVKHVLPYLIRRAEENTSVKGQTGRELKLIRKEVRRRRK